MMRGIITVIENYVLLSSVLAVVGAIVAWATRTAARRGYWAATPHALTRVFSATLALPALLSFCLVVAAFVPQWWMAETAFRGGHASPMHDHHLLSALTAPLQPVAQMMAFTMLAAALLVMVGSALRRYRRLCRVISLMETDATAPSADQVRRARDIAAAHGLRLGLLVTDYPVCFLWGSRAPKVILSSGILAALTEAELRGVLDHEAAHHARRDNVTNVALAILSYASPMFPLSRVIARWYAAQVELVCDEIAAAGAASPLDIADALVKVHRQAGVAAAHGTFEGAPAFVPDDRSGIEHRIRRLVEFADAEPTARGVRPLSRGVAPDAVLLIVALGAGFGIAACWSPLAVHAAAELFLDALR